MSSIVNGPAPGLFGLLKSGPRTVVRGVGHVPTIFTTPGSDTVIFVPFSRLPVALAVPIPWPPSPSALVGVGHVAGDPVEPLANVRGVDRESRNICRPAGVTFSRQISAHSVEPTIASLPRNLLSHDDRGPDGGDEAMEVGPQVPWIVCTGAFSCDAERLARARSGPDRPVVWPSGKTEGESPPSDSGEEVALGEASEVQRLNIDN
jgi:hypothetical protein